MVTMQYRKVEEIAKLEGNPRKIQESEVKRLMVSIQRLPDYFEAHPIVLSDRTGKLVVIDGNQRLEASKRLGLKEVPTALMTGLTEEREKEIILRANVLNGEWDLDALQEWDKTLLEESGLPEETWNEEYFDLISMDDLNLDKKGIQNTEFTVTFCFDNKLKDSFDIYFKDNGKESITQLIIDTICQDAEAK